MSISADSTSTLISAMIWMTSRRRPGRSAVSMYSKLKISTDESDYAMDDAPRMEKKTQAPSLWPVSLDVDMSGDVNVNLPPDDLVKVDSGEEEEEEAEDLYIYTYI